MYFPRVAGRTISPQIIRDLFHYFPDTGELIRKEGPRKGKSALSPTHGRGYSTVSIERINFLAHRVIFAWMTGVWPEHDVDHINGDRRDNRWCNLREATRSENLGNGRSGRGKYSAYKGVCKIVRDYPLSRPWVAYITKAGKRINLGSFSCEKEAARAYDNAAKALFGDYAYLNFREPE